MLVNKNRKKQIFEEAQYIIYYTQESEFKTLIWTFTKDLVRDSCGRKYADGLEILMREIENSSEQDKELFKKLKELCC